MPSRILLITDFCITLFFAAVATAQTGRLLNSRRYTPSNYYPAPLTRTPRLSLRQMDEIYGPSILVRSQRKSAETASVVQPR